MTRTETRGNPTAMGPCRPLHFRIPYIPHLFRHPPGPHHPSAFYASSSVFGRKFGGAQKDFLGPLFKKLGNHSSFYEWNLGYNRAQKWRKLHCSSHFLLLRSRASSELSFHFSGERQRLKLGMLEEKDTNYCSRRL